jgi:hypothetical protein
MTIPTKAGPDTVCVCGHWYEEHEPRRAISDLDGSVTFHYDQRMNCEGCDAGGTLFCTQFTFDPEANTPEAIADRGGDPEFWPQWVKDEIEVTA